MRLNRFAWYAWVVLAYNIIVVLWGAFVRATGSGAGCGAHWPVCNGQVIPRNPSTETLIEFTHRLSSGLAFLLVLVMLVWAFRAFGRGHIVRRGAAFSMVFIITEALVGAGLVLFEWVAGNDSVARVYSMAVHLINTFLLLATLFLTAYWAAGGARLRAARSGDSSLAAEHRRRTHARAGSQRRGHRPWGYALAYYRPHARGSPLVARLISLRIYHPLIAIAVGLYWMLAARVLAAMRATAHTRAAMIAITVVFLIQLAAGVINVALKAPVWMQLVHLLLADLLWLAVVWFSAGTLAVDAPRSSLVKWSDVFGWR